MSFLLCGTLSAQTHPDAGTLLQEQRQQVPSLPDRLPDQEKRGVVKPPLTDTGIKVLVKEFRFTGNYEGLATDAELQQLVREYIGKELGLRQLQHVAAIVTNYLREKKGYLLARAYVPKQDVTDGIVEIGIVSGRIDSRVRLDISRPSRIDPALLSDIAGRAVPEGSPARIEHLERAILLMNDLPGIKASASLEPGTTPGGRGRTCRLIVEHHQ